MKARCYHKVAEKIEAIKIGFGYQSDKYATWHPVFLEFERDSHLRFGANFLI